MNACVKNEVSSNLTLDQDHIIYSAQFKGLRDNPKFGTCPQGIFCYSFPTSEKTQTVVAVMADFHSGSFKIKIFEEAMAGHFYDSKSSKAMSFEAEASKIVLMELEDNLKDVLRHNLKQNKTAHLITAELVRDMQRTIHYRLSECLIRYQSHLYQEAINYRILMQRQANMASQAF